MRWQKKTKKTLLDGARRSLENEVQRSVSSSVSDGIIPPVSGISNSSSVGNTVFGPEIIREIMGFESETHIDELAETSVKNNKPYEADTKNHAFAKDGFEYRTAYFQDFDGQYYKLNISIGHNGNVATIYNVGEIKKAFHHQQK